MESQAAQKAERKLAKVDRKRWMLQVLSGLQVVAGPPFSVMPDEINGYWPALERVAAKDDLETCPPKFRKAGLKDIAEVFWRSGAGG